MRILEVEDDNHAEEQAEIEQSCQHWIHARVALLHRVAAALEAGGKGALIRRARPRLGLCLVVVMLGPLPEIEKRRYCSVQFRRHVYLQLRLSAAAPLK
jgi:hypothetical protein